DEQSRIEGFQRFGRFLGGSDGSRLSTEILDRRLQAFSRGDIIFNDEHFQGVSSGSSRMAVMRSDLCSRRTVPPAAAADNRARASPIPHGRPARAQRGEKSFSGSWSRVPGFSMDTRNLPSSRVRRTDTESAPEASMALVRRAERACSRALRSPLTRPPVFPSTATPDAPLLATEEATSSSKEMDSGEPLSASRHSLPFSKRSNARESSERAVASASEGSAPRRTRRSAPCRWSATAESGVARSWKSRCKKSCRTSSGVNFSLSTNRAPFVLEETVLACTPHERLQPPIRSIVENVQSSQSLLRAREISLDPTGVRLPARRS